MIPRPTHVMPANAGIHDFISTTRPITEESTSFSEEKEAKRLRACGHLHPNCL